MKLYTEEQLKELCLKSFNEGQLKGIELACDMLSKGIEDFKSKISEIINTEAQS